MRVYYEKLGSSLKPIVAKYRLDLLGRFKDVPRKLYSSELKPSRSKLSQLYFIFIFLSYFQK